MINRDSKKASLLLSMIIGAQLWGSKEMFAAKEDVIGKVVKIDGCAQTVVSGSIPQIEPARTITQVGPIRPGYVTIQIEAYLVRKIDEMMAVVCNDLSREQQITVLIDRYVPELKGITTTEGLKTRIDILLKDLLMKADEDMLDNVKEEDWKEAMDMIFDIDGGEILEELRAMWTTFNKELKEIVTGPEFKQIYENESSKKGRGQKVLSKYININFKDTIRQGEKFIDKINHTMVSFLKKINVHTSTAAIEVGVSAIAVHYNAIFMKRNCLKHMLKQSEVADKGCEEAGVARFCGRNQSNATDEMKGRDRARILILDQISRYKGVEKASKLYKMIRKDKVLSEKDWIGIAMKRSKENDKSEISRSRFVKLITDRLRNDIIDWDEILVKDDNIIGSNLDRLITGKIFEVKRLSLEQFGRRAKLRKTIKDWNPEISIPMGKVEFSVMDINTEKDKIKPIVDSIKNLYGVQRSTQTE